MGKLRVAVSQLWYPFTLGRYMIDALSRRDDVELWTCGPFTNTWIPWNGGMHLNQEHVIVPDVPLPDSLIGSAPPSAFIKADLPWEPDLFLMIDAGFHFADRPPGKLVGHIQTDPHAIKNYDHPRSYSDISWCMQTPYMKPGDRYLAYAYDQRRFYPEDVKKQHDVTMIGLQYPHRIQTVNQLRGLGVRVFSGIGIIFDEYRRKYNEGRVAFSWSSLDDLPCRVFEACGMAIPLVTNRMPDLATHFVENEHYLGFSSQEEAIEKIMWALNHPVDAEEMANSAHRKALASHTWDHRMEQVLLNCGLI